LTNRVYDFDETSKNLLRQLRVIRNIQPAEVVNVGVRLVAILDVALPPQIFQALMRQISNDEYPELDILKKQIETFFHNYNHL